MQKLLDLYLNNEIMPSTIKCQNITLDGDIDDLDDLLFSIKNSNQELKSNLTALDFNRQNYKANKREMKHKKRIFVSDVARDFIIPTAIIITSAFSVSPLAKSLTEDHNICPKTTTIYDEDTKDESSHYVNYKGQTDKTYIIKAERLDENGQIETVVYDASGLNFENDKDYLNYDLNKLEKVSDGVSLTVSPSEVGDIIVEKWDYEIDKMENDKYFETFIILYSIFCAIVVLGNIIFIKLGISTLGEKLNALVNDYRNLKEQKEEYKTRKKEILENIQAINYILLEEINKNEDLRNKYIEVFDKNKDKMLDPSMLESSFNELLKNLDTSKLRKELK